MNRDKEIAILADALATALEKRRPIDGDETLVAVTDYTDPTRFQHELDRVFRRELNVVTLSSAVAAEGDFVTAEVVGTPVLVVRGADARLRAFLNVCRHRGATIEVRANGRCKRFVCPYHAWTYNPDGSLHKVRHPDGFPTLDKADHSLVELHCVEAAGMVFVCPTPGLTPDPLPEAMVDELEAMLGPRPTAYASTTKTWTANWKIIVEGGIESYHFRVAHKDTIAPFFGDTTSTWERIGAHRRSVLPKKSVLKLQELPQEQWDIRDHTHVVYTIHPNALILLQKSHFDLILLAPLSVDETRIEVHTVGAAPAIGDLPIEQHRYLQRNHAISNTTLDEDFVIGEQIQRGLRTGANTHFRFGRFEGALTDWRRQLDGLLDG